MENMLDIIDSIASEKGLNRENVTEAIKTAFIQTAKRLINPTFAYEADIDDRTKQVKLRQVITVIADDAPQLEGDSAGAYMSITAAKEIDDEAEIGDQLQMEHELETYGRSAFATLHREIEFHIQRLVENELYDKYKNKINLWLFLSTRTTLSSLSPCPRLMPFSPRPIRVESHRIMLRPWDRS